jgi:CO dehydrogenase nickel-insertion accessory protein CooC1
MVHVEKVIKTEKLGIVFNRVYGNEDVLKKAAAEIGIEIFGFIPQDEKVAYYDLMGKSILGLQDSPALKATRDIVSKRIFPERFK